MGVEIERKFLVRGDAWKTLATGVLLRQGYLSSHPERVVRVRIEGGAARLTIKGKSSGASRGEWEYPIPLADAQVFLDTLCERPIIEKYRYRIPCGGLTWEVDEFLGENAGLIVAEIELASEDQAFERPDWVDEEVTHDARYFNSSLLRHPYARWPTGGAGAYLDE
ncbi:CYTH domain-containing protein [Noviherbaspirillum aridicola]|uniref:CYTH domain-containing protein n=1 Tax=Noviherbaspirillum aridicola TaxID=2849687 RepID=A0ABQ4Q5T7_9BURK|nr:CYTH domain-containing protein [Noviherbaspirillum aridicola]GIZ52572.1 CYTH domain-containing protein [Noviherbaspirillum aridicola]